MKPFAHAPAAALIVGATLWGLVWYPYRRLALAGLDGAWATLATYAAALAIGALVFRAHLQTLRRMPALAWLMGAAIGWSNLGYVLGVLEGEVMRVLLLFYLAPLWTVPLAALLLRERLDAAGALVIALATAGAATMLWRADLGAPWPASMAEWFGVGAGFLFALGNVLVRRLESMTDAAKSIVVWAGVAVAGALHAPFSSAPFDATMGALLSQWPLVLAIALALVVMSYALQYGLSRMPANRAIVILLFELVVAAFGAYFLAGETLRLQDWIGGGLIVAACLASARS